MDGGPTTAAALLDQLEEGRGSVPHVTQDSLDGAVTTPRLLGEHWYRRAEGVLVHVVRRIRQGEMDDEPVSTVRRVTERPAGRFGAHGSRRPKRSLAGTPWRLPGGRR